MKKKHGRTSAISACTSNACAEQIAEERKRDVNSGVHRNNNNNEQASDGIYMLTGLHTIRTGFEDK